MVIVSVTILQSRAIISTATTWKTQQIYKHFLHIYLELVVNHCDLNLKPRILRYQHIQLCVASSVLKKEKKSLCLMKASTGLHYYVPDQGLSEDKPLTKSRKRRSKEH